MLPLLCLIGRGSRSKVCSSALVRASRFPTDSPRMTGATRAAKPPKSERGGSVPNEFVPNLPRPLYRLAAGVAPHPLMLGQFRARSTACPAWSAPRAAYAYRLRLFSPDGENRSPRWGRLRDTTTDDNGTRGGAVGCCSAWRFAKAGSAALWGAGGTWRCVCNAGKPCGPKRSADGRARRGDRDKHPHKMWSAKAGVAAKRGDRGK